MGKSGSAAVSGITSAGCCAQRRLKARLRNSSRGTASSENGALLMATQDGNKKSFALTTQRVSNIKRVKREAGMNRRDFLKTASSFGTGMLVAPSLMAGNEPQPAKTPVAFVKTTDRAAGVSRAIDLLGLERFRGKDLFVKP